MSDVVVTARDLKIGWSADDVLLEHATFEVRQGEIFGILGRSACGKTTLLRVLIGLEDALAGEISIEGKGGPKLEAGRPRYGVMFQQGALLGSMTVGENVALALGGWTDLPSDAIGRWWGQAATGGPGGRGAPAAVHALGRDAEARRDSARDGPRAVTPLSRRAVVRARPGHVGRARSTRS